MGYELEGRMAEACTCKTFCPCTAGLEPDGGFCEFSWVFHFDRGQIEGVDVGGLSVGMLGHLDGAPGVPGTVRLALFVDDLANDDQEQALLAAFTGKAGGPLADLAGLVGEVVTVERVPIDFDVAEGSGSFAIGDVARGELAAHRSPSGVPTTMRDFALSPVLGATAYAAMPKSFELRAAQHGFTFTPNSATQFEFHHVVA
jgi:hypothetical protein